MALTWHEATSGVFRLVGNNQLYLKLKWAEEIFGNTNRVHVRLIVRSYSIAGNWNCRLKINGADKGAPRIGIYHGTNSSMGETVVRSEYQDITNGATSITLYGAIEGMDYYDVGLGSGSQTYYNPSFSHTISISVPNSPPPTPTLKCLNRKEGSKYLAEDKLELECSAVSDPNGNTVTYAIYGSAISPSGSKLSFGDSNSCVHWSTNRRASIGITQYPRGTRFYLRARAFDNYGAGSGSSAEINVIWRNNKPNKVTGFSPSSGYFNTDSFTIKWSNPGDADGTALSYELHVSKNGGTYSKVSLSSTSATSYTQNISSDAEGTSYRFKIWAYDQLVWSDVYESGYYYKNKRPTAPTNIFPNSGFYLGSTNLTWNRSTDPENRGIKNYEVFINDILIGKTTNTSMTYTIPSSDPEGKAYKVSVRATDYDDKTGEKGYATGSFYKASSPKAPSWITTGATFHENSIPLKWESISSNGAGTSYVVEYTIDGTAWNHLADVKVPNYTHIIEEFPRGTMFIYRIKAINTFGQESPWKVSASYYRKQIPLTPKIDYPANGSTIYNRSTSICFQSFDEPDYQQQIVYVDCNGTIYNSVDDSDMFMCGGSDYLGYKDVFHTDNLPIGLNTISIYCNNGGKYTIQFRIEENPLSCNTGDSIDDYFVNELLNKVNNLRKAYKLSKVSLSEAVVEEVSYVKYKFVKELRKAIDDITAVIKDYESYVPRLKENNWSELEPNGIIYAKFFQEIINAINNI